MLTAQLLSEIIQVELLPAFNKKVGTREPVQIAGDTVLNTVVQNKAGDLNTAKILKLAVLFTMRRHSIRKKDIPKFPENWLTLTADQFAQSLIPPPQEA